jgi:hypothetical protein
MNNNNYFSRAAFAIMICLSFCSCSVIAVGDAAVSITADVVSTGVSVVSTGVKATTAAVNAVIPEKK